MKNLIKILLRENLESKLVSVKYLQGLLKNTTNKSAKNILSGWISIGDDKVKLSPKQYQLLQDIKRGGPKSGMYSTKN